MHAHIAAGQGEGIDAWVAHQEHFPRKALVQVSVQVTQRFRPGHERRPNRLHVVQQERVVDVVRVAPNLAHDLLAQTALSADAEVFFGGVAQGGQIEFGGTGMR